MTFRTLSITTHASTGSPIIISDMGFDVPAAGSAAITIDDSTLLDIASNSNSLRTLSTDGAFPLGMSTIIVDDGDGPLPPSVVSAHLDALTRFEEDWIVIASGPGTGIHQTTTVTAGGDVVVAIGP